MSIWPWICIFLLFFLFSSCLLIGNSWKGLFEGLFHRPPSPIQMLISYYLFAICFVLFFPFCNILAIWRHLHRRHIGWRFGFSKNVFEDSKGRGFRTSIPWKSWRWPNPPCQNQTVTPLINNNRSHKKTFYNIIISSIKIKKGKTLLTIYYITSQKNF